MPRARSLEEPGRCLAQARPTSRHQKLIIAIITITTIVIVIIITTICIYCYLVLVSYVQ